MSRAQPTVDPELIQRLSQGEPAARLCAELSDRSDARLVGSWEAEVPAAVRAKFDLVATGGYGRREMYPHADLDLLLLYDGEDGDDASASSRLDRAVPGAPAAVRAWIVGRQDDGARVAVRVRSLAEQRRHVRDDVTVAAASLDGRLLAAGAALGDPAADARATIAALFPGGETAFCRLIYDGLRQRHAQFGASGFFLEPQLKTGRGGLRDAHAVRWAAVLRFGTADPDELVRRGALTQAEANDLHEPWEFVARTRLALHALSRWKNDRLVFERQEETARLMGFGHGDESTVVAAFMKAYFRHADQLANVAERLVHRWAVPEREEVEDLGGGLAIRSGLLSLETATEPGTDLDPIVRVVDGIEAHRRPLHPATRGRLRDLADSLPADVARSADANAILDRVVASDDPNAYALRVLLDLGFFRRFVPEWSHLVGHTSHDVYHVYTTDRHLLEALLCILRIEADDAVSRVPPFVRAAYDRALARDVRARRILRLATLLHDVAKGLDGDHSLIGAGLAAEVARRMGWPVEDREQVRWLVLEHLAMARTSQRRDLSKSETIARFVETVTDETLLDLLTVLTWADMSSVAPTFPSAWKLELLRTLHEAAGRALREGDVTAPDPRERPGVRELLASQSLGADTLEAVIEGVGRARIDSMTDEELLATFRLLPDVIADGLPRIELDASRPDGRARLTVCAKDRDALLADVAAAVASERINILQARIATTPDGFIVDHFELDWLDPGGRALHPRRRDALHSVVTSVVEGRADGEGLLSRSRRETRLAQPHRPPVPTRVAFLDEDTGDDDLAILEVKTRDRVGLLADLARTLAEMGLSIERSLIVAEGDRAIDTFYLRLPARGVPSAAEVVERLEALLQSEAAG